MCSRGREHGREGEGAHLLGRRLDVPDLAGHLLLAQDDERRADELARAQQDVVALLVGAVGKRLEDVRLPAAPAGERGEGGSGRRGGARVRRAREGTHFMAGSVDMICCGERGTISWKPMTRSAGSGPAGALSPSQLGDDGHDQSEREQRRTVDREQPRQERLAARRLAVEVVRADPECRRLVRGELVGARAQLSSERVVDRVEDAHLARGGEVALRARGGGVKEGRGGEGEGSGGRTHKEGVDGSLLARVEELLLEDAVDAASESERIRTRRSRRRKGAHAPLRGVRQQAGERLLARARERRVDGARPDVDLAERVAVLLPKLESVPLGAMEREKGEGTHVGPQDAVAAP